MQQSLWSRNYTLLMMASAVGAAGGIAGSYAMSFLVFDETGSTLATGFLAALQIVPHFLIPIWIAPWMDRFPRKPFLVGGDLIGGLLYAIAGIYLKQYVFSYPLYLVFSLVINSVNAFDALAFNSIFPKTIPPGWEDRGFAVSAMLYPMLNILVMPLAAALMDLIGIANILLLQSGLSLLAAVTENGIKIEETVRINSEKFGFSLWWQDIRDGMAYIRGEKGLLNIYAYDAVANGAATAYGPIQVAFFRTMPGFSAQLYAFFSFAEFVGRTAGGIVCYRREMKPEKRRKFVYSVQQFYNMMDAVLLWLPYPWMLINRGLCGFLGINSATVRTSSIQRYLPEEYRARVHAFSSTVICVFGSIASVALGALGEIMDYRIAMSVGSCIAMVLCWLTVGKNKTELDQIYLHKP